LSTKAFTRLKDYIEIALNSKFIDSFNLEHAARCEKWCIRRNFVELRQSFIADVEKRLFAIID